MPLFSVIVPVYKVEKYLDDCVQSILQQTFKDFELILVDDGSPDNCPAMCDKYVQQDSRVSVLHKKNGGLSDARNQGVSVSKGEYVLFVDSDDKYKNLDGFAALSERIGKYHEDVIQISSEDFFQDSGKRVLARGNYDLGIINNGDKNTTVDYLFESGQFAGSAWLMCVKRSLLIENDITFPIGVTAEDYGWLISVISNANTYGTVNELIYEYKKGMAESITSKPRVSGIRGIYIALQNWRKANNCSQGLNEFAAYIYLVMLLNYSGLTKEERVATYNILKNDAVVLNKSKKNKNKCVAYLISMLGIDKVASIIKRIRR